MIHETKISEQTSERKSEQKKFAHLEAHDDVWAARFSALICE